MSATTPSSNPFTGIVIRESADDGSDFANPTADYRRLFLGEDGSLHLKDSAGSVTDVGGAGGSVATDAIFDAAGDLVQGTGANTAAKLTLGAAGTVVRSTGSTNAYAYPPGYEFDYAEVTTSVDISATSEATANTVVSGAAVTYDGSTIIMVEFFAPVVGDVVITLQEMNFWLYDGASSIGAIAQLKQAETGGRSAVYGARRLTPSNASHTYSIRASIASNHAYVYADTGGNTKRCPAFIRITKV